MSDIVVELAKRKVITQTGLVTEGPDGELCANTESGVLKSIIDSGVPISGGSSADWSVNDPNAAGYVKNRTHWKEVNTSPFVIGGGDNYITPAFFSINDPSQLTFPIKYSCFVWVRCDGSAKTIDLVNALCHVNDVKADDPKSYPRTLEPLNVPTFLHTMPTESNTTVEIPASTQRSYDGPGFGFVAYDDMLLEVTVEFSGTQNPYILTYHATPIISGPMLEDGENHFINGFINVCDNFSNAAEFLEVIKNTFISEGYHFDENNGWVDENDDPITWNDKCNLVFSVTTPQLYKIKGTDMHICNNLEILAGESGTDFWNIFLGLSNISESYLNKFEFYNEKSVGGYAEIFDIGVPGVPCPVLTDGLAFTIYPEVTEILGRDEWSDEDIDDYVADAIDTYSSFNIDTLYEGTVTEEIYHTIDPKYLPSTPTPAAGGLVAPFTITPEVMDSPADNLSKSDLATRLNITEDQVTALFENRVPLLNYPEFGNPAWTRIYHTFGDEYDATSIYFVYFNQSSPYMLGVTKNSLQYDNITGKYAIIRGMA